VTQQRAAREWMASIDRGRGWLRRNPALLKKSVECIVNELESFALLKTKVQFASFHSSAPWKQRTEERELKLRNLEG
jgi:hypothetical protein